jgi:hypothetical protein
MWRRRKNKNGIMGISSDCASNKHFQTHLCTLTLIPTPLALVQTLPPTLTGSFLPLSRWSINHNPTTNSILFSRPMARLSTRSQTSSRTCVGRRLRVHISWTTRLSTSSDGSSSGGARSGPMFTGAGKKRPLFAAQTPSYRFRSRSVIWSRHLFRVPSWCLFGCFRPLKPRIRVPFFLYRSTSSSSSDDEGSLRKVVRSLPADFGGDCFGGDGERRRSEWW